MQANAAHQWAAQAKAGGVRKRKATREGGGAEVSNPAGGRRQDAHRVLHSPSDNCTDRSAGCTKRAAGRGAKERPGDPGALRQSRRPRGPDVPPQHVEREKGAPGRGARRKRRMPGRQPGKGQEDARAQGREGRPAAGAAREGEAMIAGPSAHARI